MRYVSFTILLCCVLMSRCLGPPVQVKLVSNSTPLTFKLNGWGEVDWIWVQGPYQNVRAPAPEPPRLNIPRENLIWHIFPPKFIPVNEVPAIMYGQLPEGWRQESPGTGTPPPLLDGYVYYVGVVPVRNGGSRGICVYIKDGKIEPYTDDLGGNCSHE